jgi:hypothetical protein
VEKKTNDAHHAANEPSLEGGTLATQSKAVFVFLAFAGVMVLGATTMVVRAKPIPPARGNPSSVAHSPSEFPKELAALDDAIAGLPEGAAKVTTLVYAAPPPFSEDMFESETDEKSPVACVGCHASRKPNTDRRKLERMHDNVKLTHGDLWCTSCHDPSGPNRFRLAEGTTVDVADTPRLCGQCHSGRYKDWTIGAHGKRTGYWNGPRRVLVCLNCHDPHSPRFKDLKPLPPPTGPYRGDAGTKEADRGHGH